MLKALRKLSPLKIVAAALLLAGGVSLVANLVSLAFVRQSYHEAEKERQRLVHAAFHAAAHEIGVGLKEQQSLAEGVSLLLTSRSDDLTGEWIAERLAQIFRWSSTRIRGLGFLPREWGDGSSAFYTFRNYGRFEHVSGAAQWDRFKSRVGYAGLSDDHTTVWKVMQTAPGDSEWNATSLLMMPVGQGSERLGWVLVEASLRRLAGILLKVEQAGGRDVACLLPDGVLCKVVNDNLVVEDATDLLPDRRLLTGGQTDRSGDEEGRETRVSTAEIFRRGAAGDLLAVGILDSEWILSMRQQTPAPMPEMSWTLPVGFLFAAFIVVLIEVALVGPANRARADIEYLNRIARQAAEHAPLGSVATRKNKGTTAFLKYTMYYSRSLLNRLFGLRMDKMTQERVESELRVARQIQFSLVPARFPSYSEWREFDLYSVLSPAREVGGDYYDFFMRDANRIVFAVGDVSGKGVPAAMYMAVCRTMFRTLARQAQQPGELLTRLNEMLIRDNQSDMYITMACFFVDLPSGRCLYSLGGHPSPLLLHAATGKVETIDVPRESFIGLKSGVNYPLGELTLRRGDAILLYTDGVTDARNESEDELGLDRLKEAFFANAKAQSCKTMISNIEIVARQFAGGHEPTDDITLLGFRYWGPGGQRASQIVRVTGKGGQASDNGKTEG